MQNLKNIDLIIQYALVVAGQQDPFERKLGRIHLIKYVYLADLAYAKYHDGESFTGLKWIFHHFGPWSVECYKRIEPALSEIGAHQMVIESDKYGDFVRWESDDPELFDKLTDILDLTVSSAIQHYVRKFGNDTYNLLDYIYKTGPMLNAAPEEMLDLSHEVVKKPDPEHTIVKTELTDRQKKKQRERFLDFKKHLNERLEAKINSQKASVCQIPPRYDDVFFDGLAKLDEDERKAPLSGDFVGVFADNVWKSRARHDPEIS